MGQDGSSSERPTVPPPFDPAAFARDSETQLSTVPALDSSVPTPRRLVADRPSEVRAILASSPELEETALGNVRDALGDDTVPVLLASQDELGWLDLPEDATRLLAHVNGVWPFERVCAMANVSPEDGALVLLELAEQGIVAFR